MFEHARSFAAFTCCPYQRKDHARYEIVVTPVYALLAHDRRGDMCVCVLSAPAVTTTTRTNIPSPVHTCQLDRIIYARDILVHTHRTLYTHVVTERRSARMRFIYNVCVWKMTILDAIVREAAGTTSATTTTTT